MKKKILAAAVAIGVLAGFLIWKNREMSCRNQYPVGKQVKR